MSWWCGWHATPVAEVESFLKSSKLSIERQVMLEAKIVEVTLKDGYQSGINWTQQRRGNHRISVGATQPHLGAG